MRVQSLGIMFLIFLLVCASIVMFFLYTSLFMEQDYGTVKQEPRESESGEHLEYGENIETVVERNVTK